MQEGDAAVTDADPRLAVDQLEPGAGELLQGRVDVVDRVGDVMQPGALAGEERADRGVGAKRAQQLHMPVPDVEQDRLDPLRLDRLAVRQGHLEARRVELERRVDVLDGDADVVDLAEHSAGV